MKRFFDSKYLKSAPAAIKVIELLALLGAVVTVFTYNMEVTIQGTMYSRTQFFLLVTMTAWIIEFIVFIVILMRLAKNLPVPWPWVNIAFGALFAIFTLLATGLLASSVATMLLSTKLWPTSNREWERINYCQYIDRTEDKTSCLALEGGTGFGFLSGLLFLVDIFVNVRAMRRKSYAKEPALELKQNDDITATTTIK